MFVLRKEFFHLSRRAFVFPYPLSSCGAKTERKEIRSVTKWQSSSLFELNTLLKWFFIQIFNSNFDYNFMQISWERGKEYCSMQTSSSTTSFSWVTYLYYILCIWPNKSDVHVPVKLNTHTAAAAAATTRRHSHRDKAFSFNDSAISFHFNLFSSKILVMVGRVSSSTIHLSR